MAEIKIQKDEPTARITTLLFDLDNTLIPTQIGDAKAIKKLADIFENQFAFTKKEAVSSTQAFLKSFRRCPDNSQTSLDSWRTYLWREALPDRYKYLAEQIYPKWLQLRFRYLAIPPSYAQMLMQFREAGKKLALITNGPSNAQWEKIKKLNVSQYFDCVLVSSDLPWEKPHPNIFYAACNFLAVKPAECAMIGDKLETDIKGGCLAKLGLTFWTPLSNVEIDLTDVEHPPDFILKNLLEIFKYFSALNPTTSSSSMQTIINTPATCISSSSQSRRRNSQINSSMAATSTCDSDNRYQRRNKTIYRCSGGSLSAIESHLNSEAENSSDSLFG